MFRNPSECAVWLNAALTKYRHWFGNFSRFCRFREKPSRILSSLADLSRWQETVNSLGIGSGWSKRSMLRKLSLYLFTKRMVRTKFIPAALVRTLSAAGLTCGTWLGRNPSQSERGQYQPACVTA